MLASCSTLKYVPKDKNLLEQTNIEIDNKKISQTEIENLEKQKPNKRILWLFRFHLWVYNLSKPGSNKGLSKLFKKVGEEPVIYDDILKEKTKYQINLFLRNKGYYNSIVSDSVVIKKQRAKVLYKIKTGIPYQFGEVAYRIDDSVIRDIVESDSSNCLLKKGANFEVDIMQSERSRIELLLKNSGYFAFTKEYVYYEADSAQNNHTTNITLGIKNVQVKSDGQDTSRVHQLYKIGNIKVNIESKPKELKNEDNLQLQKTDTVIINDILFKYPDWKPVKLLLVANNIYLTNNQLYNQRDVDETYKSLISLRIFKSVSIVFSERERFGTDSLNTIDCQISLSTITFQSYETEVELTNSAGIGVAGSVVYQHKNLFKGAEIFDLKFKGATEAIKKDSSNTYNNTLELGVEAKIQIPKFILPFRSDEFTRKYNPKTTFSTSYNYLQRPEFAIAAANLTFGYNWKGNRYNSLQVNPFDINYVKLIKASDIYIKRIDSTYLKYSRRDHFVSVSSFSFIFNNQRAKKNINFYYFRLNAETAGNTLYALSKAFNAVRDSTKTYRLFSIPFSQYIKGDIDFRYYQPINETDRIVYRIFSGMAYPYGNSKGTPFEKQYFSGGANSVRAWQEMELGPGSYKNPKKNYFLDNTADIKLEANVEYRFKLIGLLEGALFLDAGNVWSINNNDQRVGSVFYLKDFVDQIGLGTGLGSRFDFSFFIFRLDIGFKLHDPAQSDGSRWTFGRKINSSFLHYNFGIGYPF